MLKHFNVFNEFRYILTPTDKRDLVRSKPHFLGITPPAVGYQRLKTDVVE